MPKKRDEQREIPINFVEQDEEVLTESSEAAEPAPVDDPEARDEGAAREAPAANPQSQVEALTQERAALYDQLLRRQAEFENYRRRMERERAEVYQRARAEVLLELLPVLDNFERALSSFESAGGDSEAFLQGVQLIHKQLKDAVTRLGLQPVESVGQTFDPHLHEAVTIEASDEHEENTIIEEFERGYRLGDRLLRPAKVKVASTP
ncbi:MAG TPA: nucleotide exchange factor GrpE [Blastocatellia bacterium]|nr:nucleotide exchange factor GrpE [Blastocatellia bacterium]